MTDEDTQARPEMEKITMDLAEFDKLRTHLGLDVFPDARFSAYFVLNLFQVQAYRSFSTHSIIREIRHLESGDGANYTKAARPFTGPVLSGLWHKHFTDARFLLRNMRNEWEHNDMLHSGLQTIAQEHNGEVIDDKIIGKITHLAVLQALEKRGEESRMTGEWVVFVPHEGHNHYLTIAGHRSSEITPRKHDERLRAEILNNCGWEFPFLFDILGAKPPSGIEP